MKKFNPSYLFIFAGILWLFAGMISEDMSWGYALGFVFIALGIAMRIKDSFTEDSEEGELLTDEEEKQVWEEFQGKVEEDG
jgi:hypothetical protein